MERALAHFKTADPILFSLALNAKPISLIRLKDPLSALTRTILAQQVSTKAAAAIFTRFSDLFPNQKVTAAGILSLPEATLRNAGLSGAKVRTMYDLANKIKTNAIPFHSIHKLSDEEIFAALLSVVGIGPWTVSMFLLSGLGREDIFSSGDLGLRKALMKAYELTTLTETEAETLARPWSPYRSYACKILWNSLE